MKVFNYFNINNNDIKKQFLLYFLCGCIAASVDTIVFYSFAIYVLPAITEGDVVFRFLGGHISIADVEVQRRNFIYCSIIAFIFSNVSAYLLNIKYVFISKKTYWYREVVLFLCISLVSIFLGINAGTIMLKLNAGTTLSYLIKLLTSLCFNFLGRKYLVFR